MEVSQLIERCRQGDAEALGELYKAYAQRMRRVCRCYVGNEQTVDDVLHDAFLIIFTSIDRLRDAHKAEAWMMAITRNVASKYKEHLNSIPTVPLEEADHVPDSREETTRGDISLDFLMQAVDSLPEGYANVFRLSVLEGLSHKQIADMLGICPHSSSSQLARAKKMLRKMMQQYWAAVLLLLLVPISFFLFKKADTAVREEKSVAVKQEDWQRELPTRNLNRRSLATQETQHPLQPVTVHLPAYRTTIIAADTLQPSMAHTANSLTADSLSDIAAQEQVKADTASTDTAKMIRKTVMPIYDMAELLPHKPATDTHNEKAWSLELAYAGQLDEQNLYNQPFSYKPILTEAPYGPGPSPIPTVPTSIDNWSDYAIYLANKSEDVSSQTRSIIMRIALNNANRPGEDKILRTSHHLMPVTWSLALKYRLTHRFSLESGLSYSRLASDFEMGADGNTIREQQTLHYLGIPMKGIYNMHDRKRWSVYGSIGLTTEIPIRSTLLSDFYVNGLYEAGEKTTFCAPWQFSTTFGLGLQIHLTPSVGFFVEPSLQYFIPTHSDIETYRTEHPFTFSLPLGIRYTW